MSNRIGSRGAWNARQPKTTPTRTTWAQRTGFMVHHSGAAQSQTLRAIQDFHMDTNGWNDIGYNYGIRPDGSCFDLRGPLVIGAHAADHNTANVGVLVVGNYEGTEPSDAVKDTLQWLYNHVNGLAGKTLAIRTHRDVNQTACPGARLNTWVKSNLGSGSGNPPPTGGGSTRPAPGPNTEFPLPANHYFGPRDGGNASVSGAYGRSFNGREDNEWLQEWGEQLQRRGWNARQGGTYLTQHGNDGIYGPEYEALARAFQADQNITVDGLIGPQTWNAAFRNPVT